MMDISIGLWTVDSGAMDPIYLATIIGMHIAIFGCEEKKKKNKKREIIFKKRKHIPGSSPAVLWGVDQDSLFGNSMISVYPTIHY